METRNINKGVNEFQLQETTELRWLFQDFTAQSRAKSKMFAFWEEYGGNGEAVSAIYQT